MSTTEPIRNPQQARELCEYFLTKGQTRNHVLVTIGLHTALRISDILRLTWSDVFDFENNRVRESLTITEKKTKKSKIIKLNKKIADALKTFLNEAKPNRPLIANSRTGKAISRIQAYRLIREAAEALAFQSRVSCHSLRKTFGYLAWKNDVPTPVLMEIFNHSSFEITRRYLGVAQDDKNLAYAKIALII